MPINLDQQKRKERCSELYLILDETFKKKTRAEWDVIFRKAQTRTAQKWVPTAKA